MLPSQWRAIAPLVGRTASQCIEHYNKLLDAALATDESESSKAKVLEPNPETKPARPDPIDMDDDEKEMLNEARARLANTRGKKAKRKAREKFLESARRNIAIQKRRELLAAGLEAPSLRRFKHGRKSEIDYVKEIPFRIDPPKGFFAVSQEEREGEKNTEFHPASIQRFEEKRRDKEEERRRKAEAVKRKEAMLRDLPAEIAKRNQEKTALAKKPLSLPAPLLTEEHLAELQAEGEKNGTFHPEPLLTAHLRHYFINKRTVYHHPRSKLIDTISHPGLTPPL